MALWTKIVLEPFFVYSAKAMFQSNSDSLSISILCFDGVCHLKDG
jgi:hypothetical protein